MKTTRLKTIKLIVISLFLLCFINTKAQILDDSTKLIYSFHSTKFYTDEYFFEDSVILKTIDSSFINKHEYDFYTRNHQFYQNLGNTITPSIPLIFDPHTNITQNLAPNRYAVFKFDKKYYNTKSPYTFLKYIQGTKGDQVFEGMYTQNINKNWNIGAEFYKGVSRKQYATTSGGEKLSSTWNTRGFTSYLSPNKRYHFLGDITTQNSKMNEQWGIVFNDISSDSAVDYVINRAQFALNNRNSGKNEQKYREYTFKHRYDIIKGYVGVYSKHNYTRDKRMYTDDKVRLIYSTETKDTIVGLDTISLKDTVSILPEFYNQLRFSTDSTYDEKLFNSFDNEVGIYLKSDLWHLEVGYLQQAYSYGNNYQFDKIRGLENAIRAEFTYRFIERFDVKIHTLNNLNGAFNTFAEFGSKYGAISYHKILSKPFLIDSYINSNHLFWKNNFDNINTDEYILTLQKQLKNFLFIKTENRITNVKNQIYYNALYNPVQDANDINILQSSNHVKLTFGKWNIEQTLLYSSTNANYIQLPTYALLSRLYWLGLLSGGVVKAQIGVDFNWRSVYMANSYSPLIQNFYVQNGLKNHAYPLFDAFANFQIKKVNLMLKAGHVNQAFGRPGYFTSAYYPSKRFYFTFGVNWRFFD